MSSEPDARLLEEKVAELPRVGLYKGSVVARKAPQGLHPLGTTVFVAEENGVFALGGNKIRQVDVLLAKALKENVDSIITSAGPQSNFCRVMAAGARYCGLEPYLVLRGHGTPARPTGNQVLFSLADAQLTWVDTDNPLDDAQAETMLEIAETLRSSGRRPAIIDIRDSEAGLTCALAATRMLQEIEDAVGSVTPRILIAAGAGNTAAGILAAMWARRSDAKLIAVSAALKAEVLRTRIIERAADVLEYAKIPASRINEAALEITDSELGPGHGYETETGRAAQTRAAKLAGTFLDLTYTAKAMAALLADDRRDAVTFVHTGGTPAIFADPKSHAA